MAEQLVDENGDFKTITKKDLNLASEKIAVVSIIGVQNTGKSTLLNKCFSTNFQVMDESKEIGQTTQGIWIANGPSLNGGPQILLIDIEGSDSAKRAQEGNDSFERKSAAFALTMSNTVIVNMECKSVGLHNGAGWPLLKTVFQVMLLGKFTGTPRKVLNLLFVLRDKTGIWEEIWRGISSSEAKLEEYFKVEVMAMSHYGYRRKEFDMEVNGVRELLSSLVMDGQTCRASKFLNDAKEKWDGIMKNEILKLNLNKAADIIYCQNIMRGKNENFLKDKEWRKTERDVESGTMGPGFGTSVDSLMGNYLFQYDEETRRFDESIRNVYREELKEKLSQVVEPSYKKLVQKMREETIEEFKKEIEEVIVRSGKFEDIKSDTFMDKFRDVRLTDAHVDRASWIVAHTSSQLEEMQLDLDSFKAAACSTMEQLTTRKESEVAMWAEGAKFVGSLAPAGIAAIAAPPIAGVAALSVSAALPIAILAFQAAFKAFSTYVETNKQIAEDRGAESKCGQIIRIVERNENEKHKKKDRK